MDLARELFRWMRHHTDLRDWGYRLTPDHTPRFANAGFASHVDWLSKRAIAMHLAYETTIYYTSRRKSQVHYLLVDVDAHHGEPDALDLTQFVVALFPGTYFEPSTNDRGYHLYVAFHVGLVPRALFARLMDLLLQALQARARDNNFRSTLELCGRCSLLSTDRKIAVRGLLAKAPRLARGRADLDAFLGAPVFELRHVFQIVCDAPDESLEQRWFDLILAHLLPQHVPPSLATPEQLYSHIVSSSSSPSELTAETTERSGYTSHNGSATRGETSGNWRGDVSGNALERMRHAGHVLARRLGRLPTTEELLSRNAKRFAQLPRQCR